MPSEGGCCHWRLDAFFSILIFAGKKDTSEMWCRKLVVYRRFLLGSWNTGHLVANFRFGAY